MGAVNTVSDVDVTPNNNASVLGQSVLGSAAVSQVDNMIRSVLGLLGRFYADLGGVIVVGGNANTITVTTASTYSTLKAGIILGFKAAFTNTGAATFNLDGLGARALRKNGDVPLVAGDIVQNGYYLVRFDPNLDSGTGAWALLHPTTTDLSIATAANFRANTADKLLDTDGVWSAADPVNLGATLSGAVSIDFNTFLSGAYGTLTGNITSLSATNIKKGQSGTIEFTQSGGPWTITLNTANFATNNGSGLALGTGLNVLGFVGLQSGKALMWVASKATA